MPNLNQVTIAGHLGRDAETTHTGSGTPVTKFSVALSRKWKDKATGERKEATDWVNVEAWSQNDFVRDRLTKGAAVLITGSIRTNTYEKDGAKRTATFINADNIQLLGGKDSGGSPPAPRSAGDEGGSFVDDDSCPF